MVILKPVKGLEPLSVTYEATALAFELHRLFFKKVRELIKVIVIRSGGAFKKQQTS